MFALARTLVDRVAAIAEAALGKGTELDPAASAALLDIVVELQAIYVDGRAILRIVDAAGDKADESCAPNRSDQLSVLIVRQVDRLRRVRTMIEEAHRLLTSVSPTAFTSLVPLLDEKSGLLTRWLQQAQQSLTSSTTVFFLPRTSVEAALATASPDDVSQWNGRDAYLKLTTSAFRDLRRGEVRDVASASSSVPGGIDRIRVDTGDARAELEAIRRQIDAIAGLTKFMVAGPTDGIRHHARPPTQPETSSTLTLLFLAANPRGTTMLALDEEKRQIQGRLWNTPSRDHVTLKSTFKLRREALIEELQRFRPTIVHFSGHGDSSGELILETGEGSPAPVAANSVAEVFRVLGPSGRIRCVVLNACYSEPLARALTQHVDCVIGMRRAISDRAAVVFASQLYSSLGYGSSVQDAFQLACAQLALGGIPEADTPQIRVRLGIDPSSLRLVAVADDAVERYAAPITSNH